MSRQIEIALDGIDERRAQWRAELPDLDTTAMAIIGRMRVVTLQLRPQIDAIFREHGLDAGEFDVIATLRRSGAPYSLRPTELYKWLMISSGGLTARLNRLEKAGLVTRSAATGDGRSMLVMLTAEGKTLAERAFRDDMAFESGTLAALSKVEIQSLETLLRKLTLSLHVPDGHEVYPD